MYIKIVKLLIALLYVVGSSSVAFRQQENKITFRSRQVLHRPGTNTESTPLDFHNTAIRKCPLGTASKLTSLRERGGEIEEETPSLPHQLIAEAVGTFLIVQIGCGVVCAAVFESAQMGLWQVAAVWGIAVTLGIYSSAAISGAHLNPAITLATATLRPKHFAFRKVIPYCIAQMLGAVVAAAVNLGLYWKSIAAFELKSGILRGTADSVVSASAFGEYWSVSSSWASALFAETWGTFILSFIIFTVTNPNNSAIPKQAIPALIGSTIACLISVIAPLTQAGFNPARDFGPRLVAWAAGWGRAVAMKGCWVYILGPVIGAIAGGFFAEKILWKEK